jgi:hypothetical protein
MNTQNTLAPTIKTLYFVNTAKGNTLFAGLDNPETLKFADIMARFHLEKSNRKDVQGNVWRIIALNVNYELRCGLDFVLSLYAGENKLHSWSTKDCVFTALIPAYTMIWQDVYNRIDKDPFYPLFEKYVFAFQTAYRRIYPQVNNITP